jgi:hypothetical protein
MSQNNSEMDFNITDLLLLFKIVYFCYQWGIIFINNFDNVFWQFGFYCVSNFLNVFINRKLKNEVDALEQYGRRSLIRISGIPEPTEERDTTEKVCKIISDIVTVRSSFKHTRLYSGFCYRFFPHFKILNLTPGSDKRTIIWRCLTTASGAVWTPQPY